MYTYITKQNGEYSVVATISLSFTPRLNTIISSWLTVPALSAIINAMKMTAALLITDYMHQTAFLQQYIRLIICDLLLCYCYVV